jgi:hypothetical protein
VRYLLRELPNLLTQSDFKFAGPGLTYNLHWHLVSQYRLRESLLQESILLRNRFPCGGCQEQNPLYNSQLAKRLGLCKSKANMKFTLMF